MVKLNWYKSPMETTHDNGAFEELTWGGNMGHPYITQFMKGLKPNSLAMSAI